MRYAIAFLLALLAAPLHAQTVDAKANLTWTLPTLYTDGKPILAGAITKVQLWARTSPIADTDTSPTVVLPGVPTSHVWTGQVPNGSTLYFRHKVCTATACSAFGPQASKGVKVDIPAVPPGISVTITVTVSSS
jgi:hypothetical protein